LLGNKVAGQVEMSAMGLGMLGLCQPVAKRQDEVVALVKAAADVGITLFDTADVYGPLDARVAAYGVSEWQLADAVDALGLRREVLIATKVGIVRTPDGFSSDSTPGYIRAALNASLRRLRVDHIDLYFHHRPDPKVPYAEAMGTMRQIFDQGLARMIGISNVDAAQIKVAHRELGVALACVQNQCSPLHPSSDELSVCRELGLTFMAWRPLGGPAGAEKLSCLDGLVRIAEARAASVQQAALAWAIHQSVVPIPGATRPETVRDCAAAADIILTTAELRDIHDLTS
jgi:aryl-alcohol dehydrogenase-like predicted oxidoreductase